MDFCLTSEFLHRLAACRLSIKLSHVTPGGGRSGLLRAAATGPASQIQSQHQDQHPDQKKTSTPEPSMHHARCPVILALAALALCSLGVSSQADREQDQYQDQDLDLELRHHRLLQRARSAGLLSQEWSKRAVEDLLAQMSRPEVDSIQTEGRMNLERSVDPPNNNNNPQRERKAGCKNFYWKGFTNC